MVQILKIYKATFKIDQVITILQTCLKLQINIYIYINILRNKKQLVNNQEIKPKQ